MPMAYKSKCETLTIHPAELQSISELKAGVTKTCKTCRQPDIMLEEVAKSSTEKIGDVDATRKLLADIGPGEFNVCFDPFKRNNGHAQEFLREMRHAGVVAKDSQQSATLPDVLSLECLDQLLLDLEWYI